jgi:hypothetical protein
VSGRWADADGGVTWLRPDGSKTTVRPQSLGSLRNGHHIQLGRPAGVSTPWDTSFEAEFNGADNAFPGIIDWLESLRPDEQPCATLAFRAEAATDDQLTQLTECAVSLAVRSPMNRVAAVALAEHVRGPLDGRERDTLAAANMQHTQRSVCQAVGPRAKFAAVFSPDREFIFGDGFYHSIRSPQHTVNSLRIVAPLTPRLMLIVFRPGGGFRTEARLVSTVIGAELADMFNDAVQVSAKDMVFFRSDEPRRRPEFEKRRHLHYASSDNPIERFLHEIPGTPTLDLRLIAALERPRS